MDTNPSSAVPVVPSGNSPVSSAPWQFIPTNVHALLDYSMGLLLILLPFLAGFPRQQSSSYATWLPIVLGAGALVYSLLTNYEGGVIRLLPMPVHLAFDFLSGLLLAASPWLFGFHDQIHLPYLVLGIFEIGAALFTRTQPFARRPATVGNLPSVLS